MADRIIPQDISPQRDTSPQRPEGGKGWLGLVVLAVLIAVGVWLVRLTLKSPEAAPEQEVVAQPAPAPEPKPAPEPEPKPKPKPKPTVAENPPEQEVVAQPAPAPEPQPTPKPKPEPTPKPAVAESPSVPEQEPAAPPAITPGQMLLDRQRAEVALTEYLATKRELDELAVLEWGGDDYAKILAQVEKADTAFSADQFPDATDGYQAAQRAGEQLASRADEAFAELVEKGHEALATSDGAEAERLYAAALAIRPEDKDARGGLRRSATIERTSALLETGRQHEANRLYELALTDFEEAVRLDPAHEEARTAAIKVRERLAEQTFREAMSDALTALKEKRLTAARERILQARALRPNAPEVKEALFQITEAERVARIDAMGEKARAAEAAEDWDEAHKQYRDLLAIDANVQFAREGAERCATCIRMRKQMDDFANHPDLLEAPDGRASARLLITEFEALALTAPKLEAQAETLTQLLTAAETPVPVSLQSDGNTRVEVYKVGRFPPFRSLPLELLPGNYTIVGYRAGFRDVRMKLEVRAGDDNLQATVQCQDKF